MTALRHRPTVTRDPPPRLSQGRHEIKWVAECEKNVGDKTGENVAKFFTSETFDGGHGDDGEDT